VKWIGQIRPHLCKKWHQVFQKPGSKQPGLSSPHVNFQHFNASFFVEGKAKKRRRSNLQQGFSTQTSAKKGHLMALM